MTWHRPVRVAVGLAACASAIGAYLTIGTRPVVTAPPPVARADASATIEGTGVTVQREQAGEEQFELKAGSVLTYPDGSTRQSGGVSVTVRNRNGKDFVVTADEARTEKDERNVELTGNVVLKATDGFELTAPQATYNRDRALVTAAGAVSFARGRLSGTATGMAYDTNTELLTLEAMPDVRLAPADEEGEAQEAMQFRSGNATLDRVQHVLTLNDRATVTRGQQSFAGDRVVARLPEDEQGVDVVELHGNSRVTGTGGSVESMAARDITLDYAEDGRTLQRAVLTGDASVEATRGAGESRRFSGGQLELLLDGDGNVATASGRDGVRVELPGAAAAQGQAIAGREFEAAFGPGGALAELRVSEAVEYREQGAVGRAVRARALRLRLKDEAVTSAVFGGGVVFEEGALVAKAHDLQYEPSADRLVLTGDPAAPECSFADERWTLTAGTRIEVALKARDLTATGGVKTVLRASTSRAGAAPLPGLLAADQQVNINAEAVTSARDGANLTYAGGATLWQGTTAIRSDTLAIDRAAGSLTADGAARLSLSLKDGLATGRAKVIRFDDRSRVLTLDTPVPPASAPGRGGAVPARTVPNQTVTTASGATGAGPIGVGAPSVPPQSYFSAAPGEIRADRIGVTLAKGTTETAALEAMGRVGLKLGGRTASGHRLVYDPAEERYELTGLARAPVSVVASCRETTGRTLIFYRSTDRILVDGNEETRTQSKGVASCVPTTR